MSTFLLFKKTQVSLGLIKLDASVSEQHSFTVDVTAHPIEKGSDKADHRRVKPGSITIEGVISNDPLPDEHAATQRRSRGTPSGSVEYSSRSQSQPERAGQALADLLRLRDSAELVQVVTSIQTYTDMTMVNLNIPREAKSGQALRFTAEFRQIQVVSNKLVVETRAPKKKKKEIKGPKPTPPVPDISPALSGAQGVGLSFNGILAPKGVTTLKVP